MLTQIYGVSMGNNIKIYLENFPRGVERTQALNRQDKISAAREYCRQFHGWKLKDYREKLEGFDKMIRDNFLADLELSKKYSDCEINPLSPIRQLYLKIMIEEKGEMRLIVPMRANLFMDTEEQYLLLRELGVHNFPQTKGSE